MTAAVLVLNVGSSSLKFALYLDAEDLPLAMRGMVDAQHDRARLHLRDAAGAVLHESWIGLAAGWDPGVALEQVLALLPQCCPDLQMRAVGHRVVHGGMGHNGPALVDGGLLAELEQLTALAPLHQPHNLAAIRTLQQQHPQLPQVACFDTAFHRSNSDVAQRYGLPDALHQSGLRRYGFHGLSYQYLAGVLPNYDAAAAKGRCIALHLGNGASLCALMDGRSAASSMGFSALDGVPMATRCGALDPGVILHLWAQGMDRAEVENLLYRQSGLLGISGVSGDMRRLTASTDPAAALAVDVFVYRIQREIGSLVAALGGLDALVFSAGIGENSPALRQRVLDGLGWLGVQCDPSANAAGGPCISSPNSRVRAYVIATDEERVIAQATADLLHRRH